MTRLDSDNREASFNLAEICASAGKLVCRWYEHVETLR